MTDATQQTKHTPGPWKWKYPECWEKDWYEGELPYLYSSEEYVAHFGDCTTYYPTSGGTPDEADRRLIAAAPDMLEALIALRDAASGLQHSDYEYVVEDQIEDATKVINLAINGES